MYALPQMQVKPSVPPGFTAMNIALVILQLLHVFWFWLVLKAVRPNQAESSRSKSFCLASQCLRCACARARVCVCMCV